MLLRAFSEAAGSGGVESAEEWRFINQKIIMECTLSTAGWKRSGNPQRAREQRGARLVNDDTALWWPARARTQKVAASFRAGSFGVLHNADEFSH